MTIIEMHQEVQLGLQRVDSSSRDDFLTEEITSYLNLAQIEFIKNRFESQNQQGFEQSPKRIADLQEVLARAILLPTLDASDLYIGSEHEYLLPYPDNDNYMFFVSAEVSVARTRDPKTSSSYLPVQPISHDQIQFVRVTPFNNPHIRIPKVIFEEDFIHVFVDKYSIVSEGRVSYIRTPDKLVYDTADTSNNVDCELAVHTHSDIVNIALRLMLGDLLDDVTPRAEFEKEVA